MVQLISAGETPLGRLPLLLLVATAPLFRQKLHPLQLQLQLQEPLRQQRLLLLPLLLQDQQHLQHPHQLQPPK